ncbi:hypothetical protein GFM29_18500 [Rhizobium leguminosarum bv. viciae]|nr:hypothetical protein [Rhizobium leguminosarum bv. viciae]
MSALCRGSAAPIADARDKPEHDGRGCRVLSRLLLGVRHPPTSLILRCGGQRPEPRRTRRNAAPCIHPMPAHRETRTFVLLHRPIDVVGSLRDAGCRGCGVAVAVDLDA